MLSESFSRHTKIRLLFLKTSHLELNTNGSVFSINGFPHVIQAGSSQNNSSRPGKAGECEKEKEKPVQHHSNVLPVLHDLIVLVIVPDMLSNELHHRQRHLHFWTELVR